MKKLALVALLISIPALAQQVAQNTTCLIGLDGGAAGTVTATCPSVLLNYEPFTVSCFVSTPAHSSSVGTTVLALSPDGTNFAGDGGVALPFNCAAASTCGVTASLSPTNPYLYGQIQTTALQDGGASAGETCIVSVVQTQTLHAPHSKTVGGRASPR